MQPLLHRLLRTALLATSILASAAAAAPPSDPRLANLPAYIERARAELHNLGLAVVVVQDGQVLYAEGFGHKEQGQPDPVGPDTLFQIGSTSKAFTTAALGILVDEGKLRWDDRVIDYLPDFQLQDPWLTRQLTVRDAVAHRSGIRDTGHFVFSVMAPDAVVEQLRYIPAEQPFRDSFQYSNLMYAVAGKIIERVSGQSWHAFVRERLLQPLQMRRSGTSAYEVWDRQYVTPTFWGTAAAGRPHHRDARDPDVAMPHFVDANNRFVRIPWQSYDNAAAAGTIVSSANDLAHWLIMHLDEGRYGGRPILQAETIKALHAAQNLHMRDVYPFTESKEGYALGWMLARHHGRPYVWHSGGILGFPAYVSMIPEARIGVAVIANSAKASAGDPYALHAAIALQVYDQLLGAPAHDWISDFATRAGKADQQARDTEAAHQAGRPKGAPPSLPLAAYAGVYEDTALHSGPVTLRVDGKRLHLSFAGTGALSGHLEPWHHDVFRLRIDLPYDFGQFPSFALGPAGEVVSMSLFGSTYQRLSHQDAK